MEKIKNSNKYFAPKHISTLTLCLILLLFFSCSSSKPVEERKQRAIKAKGDILIGIVHNSVYSNFFTEGVNLAVEEINQKGGIAGRKIKTINYDDMNDAATGEIIAAKLAANKDVVAVVGHGYSSTAIPASIIYEKAGIVFISYGAKDPDLTLYGGKFTFRNIPTHKNYAHEMARFSNAAEFNKIVVFHEREGSQKTLADIYKKEAVELGIEITATRSYFSWEKDFKETIDKLKKEYEFDSIMIAGTMPAAARLVKQLRDLEISVPIIAGDGLDSPDLWVIAGRAAEGLFVPTVFNPEYPDKMTRDFVRNFQSKYELTPDTWAAQGFDAISLIAHAINESDLSVPTVIGNTLRFLKKWKGVTGTYSFIPDGDIIDKEIFFKQMHDGEFVFVEEHQHYKSDLFNYIEEFTLRLPLKDPISTLDPGFVRSTSDIEVCEQLFPALVDLDPETCEPVPELALEWKQSRINDIVYIFFMRNDALWSNGEPVTAHDVLWAIQRNLNPDTYSPNASDLYILKNAKAIHSGEIKDITKLGVYILDEFTLVFKLEHPAPYFPAIVSLPAFRPLPGSVIEKFKDEWTEIDNIQTCGPYLPVIWQKGKGMFLKKNPDFYNAPKVAIPEVRYYITPQSSLGLAMYENNELDIMGSSYLRLPSASVPLIQKGPLKDEYSEAPHFCTYTYAFNTKLAPVDNPLVRKAISAAIDRQLLIDAVNEGNGEPAATCTRPPLFGSVSPEQEIGIGFDPFQAREWLAEAGYPEGTNFPEIAILSKKSKFHEKIAAGVQSLLQFHLNIRVKIQKEKEDDYNTIVTQGEPPHIFRTKVCNEYPDADSSLRLFDPSAPFYKTGWVNKEFTGLLKNARDTTDKEKRLDYYMQSEKILCEEDAVAIPLYFEIYHSLVKPRVKGRNHMAMGGQQIYNWYFED
ncbi:ABC transporter substrate-binding protein [Desulfobacterales bacterium HSG17]|nr:ABC transporter substrate-binding protein [Desulfobacterales bacterium HSG17]